MCVVCCLGSLATCPISTFGDACGEFIQLEVHLEELLESVVHSCPVSRLLSSNALVECSGSELQQCVLDLRFVLRLGRWEMCV